MEAVVLVTFEEPLVGSDGRSYAAQICGRRSAESRWEGWVEFVPEGGSPVLRSRRETTQPNRRAMEGWAERLTAVYLDGSLQRTLDMQRPAEPGPSPREVAPHFSGPSPSPHPGSEPAPDDTALNPFLQLRHGEVALRRELAELAASELRTIARAYHFAEDGTADLDALPPEALVDLIVRGARARMP